MISRPFFFFFFTKNIFFAKKVLKCCYLAQKDLSTHRECFLGSRTDITQFILAYVWSIIPKHISVDSTPMLSCSSFQAERWISISLVTSLPYASPSPSSFLCRHWQSVFKSMIDITCGIWASLSYRTPKHPYPGFHGNWAGAQTHRVSPAYEHDSLSPSASLSASSPPSLTLFLSPYLSLPTSSPYLSLYWSVGCMRHGFLFELQNTRHQITAGSEAEHWTPQAVASGAWRFE